MARDDLPDWYKRWGPWLVSICLVTSAGSLLGVAITTKVNQDQNEQRDADRAAQVVQNAVLLDCIGGWADDLAGTLPPVREASVARDEAVTTYRAAQNRTRRLDDKITQLFIVALSRAATGVEPSAQQQTDERTEAVRIFKAKDKAAHVERDAYRDLKDAEQALAQARAENVYPPSPKFTCSLD